MNRKKYKICIIPGDGIGPEVITQSVRILNKLPLSFEYIEAEAGYGCFKKRNTPLPKDTIRKCKINDAILFGAVTTPPNIKNYSSPIITLRKTLDLYANVRPCFSLPLSISKENIDLVIIRENTQGMYSGIEKKTQDGYVAYRVITRKACQRLYKFAAIYAQKENRHSITIVHKANILRLSDGLFLSIGKKYKRQFPTIMWQDMLVDSTAYQLVKNPTQFDIIVTTNMFGDILSDIGASQVGGLGVVASGNIGDTYALFEPVHGSAPKYSGKNTVNPTASIMASAMMLDYLGEKNYAQLIKSAVFSVLKKGIKTKDLKGSVSTSEFTDELIKEFKKEK